jgi:carbamoyltransferase
MVAAAEEERFRRIKHWAGFPSESIRYCLNAAGIGLHDVPHVAINQDGRSNMGRKLAYTLTINPSIGMLLSRWRNKRKRAGVAEHLSIAFPEQNFRGQVHSIDHHEAHLASAFHVSPFQDALVVSVDGFGDFASTAWGLGHGSSIDVKGRVYFPHSLGIFYQAITQLIGFPNYGDEYKVMGLAPYGEPRYLEQMRKIVLLQADGSFKLNLACFRHHKENIAQEWEQGTPKFGTLFSPGLVDLLGPVRSADEPLSQRHWDMARSAQAMYEEAFFHLLNTLHKHYPMDALALAGGCAMNSVANGKVLLKTPFKQLYVQSAAGDAGGAIGAAYAVWHRYHTARTPAHDHAYWGPEFSDADIAQLLRDRRVELSAQSCAVEHIGDVAALCDQTAAAIARGEVIGWFQGGSEIGPRALGNRSILASPIQKWMSGHINGDIKHREWYRPFAPAVLFEHQSEIFESGVYSPHMLITTTVKEEPRAKKGINDEFIISTVKALDKMNTLAELT